ncbi:MAG: F0F1 ATP synthase subunit delta [Thermoanaerobaculia bacterium]
MNKLNLKILARDISRHLSEGEEGLESLKLFSEIFNKNPKILKLLSNPLIPFERREEAFLKALEMAGVQKRSRIILHSLFKGYALSYLPQIIGEIEKGFLKRKGIIFVDILIPSEIGEGTKEKIVKYLESNFKRKIKPNFIIDPEILGGFEAISESYNLIASIRGNLKNLKLEEELWQ